MTGTRRREGPASPGHGSSRALGILAGGLALAASACVTAAAFRIPDGPWTPDPAAAAAFASATASCRGVRTMTAEIAVHGRAGTAKIRGRVIAGFERGGALRLEAPAPFGAPIFVMAARANRATLWLPRGRQVVRDAPVEDVLEAITGLRRSSDDVLALLAGCLADGTNAASGTGGGRNARGWLSVELGDAMRAFLRQDGAVWRVVAGQRGAAGGPVAWRVSYADFVAGFPGTIRVWQEFVTAAGASDASSLTFEVSQLEANVPIDPAAFEVAVPSDAQPLTVDELRQSGPLADRDADRGSGR
jgi:hypothetical protein